MLSPSQTADRESAPGRLRYSANVIASAFSHSKRNPQALFQSVEKTRRRAAYYARIMAAPAYDWYLKEWLRTLGRKQADIVRDLEWNPARISLMMRGIQQYNRDSVNELASYLNLAPHELLMHPRDAMALRQLRADAIRIAKDAESDEPEKRISSG